MAPIGTLHAKIQLDNPHTTHYGSGSPVTGNVVLTFNPSYSSGEAAITELFAPVKIRTNLHGRVKSKIRINRGNNSSTYRGRAPIFEHKVNIFDDSLKLEKSDTKRIPFSFTFPTKWEHQISGDWEQDAKYDCSIDQAIPPSFAKVYSGFSKNNFECIVEYRIGVDVAVPHLAVRVATPEKDTEPLVHYSRPRVPVLVQDSPHKYANRVSVSNERLVPEASRPTGFRAKAKAAASNAFSSSDHYPRYAFDWALLVPKHWYIDESMPIEIFIRPREEECTTFEIIPDVNLAGFRVQIIGATATRAEKQFFTTPSSGHDDPVGHLKVQHDREGPFSKAHNDWSKTIITEPVPSSVGCTFSTVNISQAHRVKISFAFDVAGKRMPYEKEFSIAMYPPMLGAESSAGPSSNAAAGPSSRPLDMQGVAEALPQYDGAGLPEYDEATADGSAAKSGTVDRQQR